VLAGRWALGAGAYDQDVKRAFLFAAAFASACVSAPPPTVGMRETASNPPARVEGRVTDTDGRPVAGLFVEGIPRGKEIPWSPGARTDADGRFTLSLAAPGTYGFVLTEGDRTVVTDDPRDPSRVLVALKPGDHRAGIELVFLREERKKTLETR
jgi:carboxypeptidase family protein